MSDKIEMTREGLEKLEEEYRHLLEVDRPEVIEALKAARAQGDLSENADYDAARNRQGEIEARIAEIEHIKDVVVVVDGDRSGKVKKINIGYEVTYREIASGEVLKVRIKGSIEANPTLEVPCISTESPLGKALVGKAAGDKATVLSRTPYEIEILDAAYSND